ncbi:zinc finger protein draculin-like isoform X2 [Amphibalanus amphitrite]|nr:zinc finger protein draculin-like isoform X2 [Amphibalanus amphitrite]XP_043242328.1 zinc finger protein draculin-like isoform X2 [Amphibalanus amphitrite]XP_043242329.1 zinc finger protein draculin-like isoform X2 [Amphibalanus amphitrite]
MQFSGSPTDLAAIDQSYLTNDEDVDLNNNVVTEASSDRSKSMTGTAAGSAAGSGPEVEQATGTVDPLAVWNPSGADDEMDMTGITEGMVTATSPLVVDEEIGRVFLTANRALYGCDDHDAAESSAAHPAASDEDADEEDGRLFIALDAVPPEDGPIGTPEDERQSPEDDRPAEAELEVGQEPGEVEPGVESGSKNVTRRRVREQDKPLECPKCGRRFILSKMLDNHKCGVMYTCTECSKTFKKRCQLQAHSFIHKQAKDFVCSICQRAFKEKSNFNRHVRTHSSLRPYKCPHCVKCFKVAATLYVHRLTHDARGRFVCDFCQKDFKRPEHLRQHRRIHTGEKPYRCSVCQQCFTTDNTLRTHMRRHTGERPYPCPICQKRFTQSSAMKTHWKRHSESREFACSMCDLKFKQKYDLNRHMVSHNTERPHQCSVCHLRFKTRPSLQKHLETHSEERHFSCGTCGKAFRRVSYLRLHEATHGASARFACTLCSKSFTRRYNLRLHQEEHEEGGRRRHFCSRCRRCFRRAAGLRQHMAVTHGGPALNAEQGGSRETPDREPQSQSDARWEPPGSEAATDGADPSSGVTTAPGMVISPANAATEVFWMGAVSGEPVLHIQIPGEPREQECDRVTVRAVNSPDRLSGNQRAESSEEELIVD